LSEHPNRTKARTRQDDDHHHDYVTHSGILFCLIGRRSAATMAVTATPHHQLMIYGG
jgi:hypothetical protein